MITTVPRAGSRVRLGSGTTTGSELDLDGHTIYPPLHIYPGSELDLRIAFSRKSIVTPTLTLRRHQSRLSFVLIEPIRVKVRVGDTVAGRGGVD